MSDVLELAELLEDLPSVEFNIEGYPFPKFIEIVRRVKPTQCTLVPDSADAFTSDHGWDLKHEGENLKPIIDQLTALGIRVSLFMDADPEQIEHAKSVGADRIELYTGPYAGAFNSSQEDEVFERFYDAAWTAQQLGLGVNAGHDLNLRNLRRFCSIPDVLEVSIGHALIADGLFMGLGEAVRSYLRVLRTA